VQGHFRPEFINRLDEMVVFHPLGREHIREIARLQLEQLGKRLKERELKLEVSNEALDLLARFGFDPVYGARPLKRAIQSMIENPLAKSVLKGDYQPRDTVVVDARAGQLGFGKR
jgi:ATP-dependent Clp protease ATP-binding subunit ClpB